MLYLLLVAISNEPLVDLHTIDVTSGSSDQICELHDRLKTTANLRDQICDLHDRLKTTVNLRDQIYDPHDRFRTTMGLRDQICDSHFVKCFCIRNFCTNVLEYQYLINSFLAVPKSAVIVETPVSKWLTKPVVS